MSGPYFKPLTPEFRTKIDNSFDNLIAELNTCEQNGLVLMQKEALEMAKKTIHNLPDGYPIPIEK